MNRFTFLHTDDIRHTNTHTQIHTNKHINTIQIEMMVTVNWRKDRFQICSIQKTIMLVGFFFFLLFLKLSIFSNFVFLAFQYIISFSCINRRHQLYFATIFAYLQVLSYARTILSFLLIFTKEVIPRIPLIIYSCWLIFRTKKKRFQTFHNR